MDKKADFFVQPDKPAANSVMCSRPLRNYIFGMETAWSCMLQFCFNNLCILVVAVNCIKITLVR